MSIEQYAGFHLAQSLIKLVKGKKVKLAGRTVVWDSKVPTHEVIALESDFHETDVYTEDGYVSVPTYTSTLVLQSLGPKRLINRRNIRLTDIPFTG